MLDRLPRYPMSDTGIRYGRVLEEWLIGFLFRLCTW